MSKHETLGCVSNVTLKKCINNKVISTYKYHNIATQRLLKSIVNYLITGSSGKSPDIPNYLGVGGKTSTTFTVSTTKLDDETSINNRLLLTRLHAESTSEIESAVYSATIPGIQFTEIQQLGLFSEISSEKDTADTGLLAGVVLDNVISIEVGSSLIVEWEIIIGNAGV